MKSKVNKMGVKDTSILTQKNNGLNSTITFAPWTWAWLYSVLYWFSLLQF